MAFVIAKYWGVMPHVIWRYPFRYFKELRDYVIAEMRPRAQEEAADEDFDWEQESAIGPSI